jgi:A/G-specific adenine glycosylase
MDLGVVLKQHVRGINLQSAHYKKQSTFEGSLRQVRAAVLKLLVNSQGARLATLKKQLPYEADKIERVVSQLFSEGFLVRERNIYRVV